MTRLVSKLNYKVIGYDINSLSIIIAKVLSFKSNNIKYIKEDFNQINDKFDIVSATSILSVVDYKKDSLLKMILLLRNEESTLIIIEPNENLSLKNIHIVKENYLNNMISIRYIKINYNL